MDIHFTEARLEGRNDGYWICLKVENTALLWELRQLLDSLKGEYIAAIKKHRQRRSLDANAYLWVLLEKIASVIHSTKDEAYLEMLGRYGVFTHVIVKPEAAERVKGEWRTVRELGRVRVNGKTGVQLQCYYGSSAYNTAEMARLIDGVVSECRELGIETRPPDELEKMKGEWNAPDDKGVLHHA